MNNHVECATLRARKRHATSAAQLCALLVPGTAAWTYRLHFSIRVWYGRLGADIRWHGIRRGNRMRNQAQIHAGRPLARALSGRGAHRRTLRHRERPVLASGDAH